MAHATEHHPLSSILHPRPVLLAGPTAVGKSEIALRLAEKVGGEIVSVDSMQVYRGMDLGTAKASPADRARVPHHLLDVVEVSQAFDAAQFVGLAQEAIAGIQSRGHVPILCGGTGLYFKALLEGLGQAPPADAALRLVLEATPLSDLLRELGERDPSTYERIDRQNPRRVIRAVEVIRLTGKPFSAQRAQWQASLRAPGPSPLHIGLARSSADLHLRISARVDAMFRRGWVAETESLLRQGLAENRTAMQALGYRQIAEHLRGERSLPATIELVKCRTRQFARRQMTWFRRQLQLTWTALAPESDAEQTVQAILEQGALSAQHAKIGA
jgi:tRNA dimethylallyltransferase